MIRTQVYITKKEKTALTRLSHDTGKSQSELIREAIDSFCLNSFSKNRIDLLQGAKGIWEKRSDLPNIHTLRREFDRSFDDNDKE